MDHRVKSLSEKNTWRRKEIYAAMPYIVTGVERRTGFLHFWIKTENALMVFIEEHESYVHLRELGFEKKKRLFSIIMYTL